MTHDSLQNAAAWAVEFGRIIISLAITEKNC